MSYVITDEDGNILDEDGNKIGKKMAVSEMTYQDVIDLAQSYRQSFMLACDPVKKAADGISAGDAETYLMQAAAGGNGGKVMDFYRSNRWLGNAAKRNEYLASDNGQDSKAKEAICDLYDTIVDSADFRRDVCKFFQECVLQDIIRYSFQAIRMKETMKSEIAGEDMGTLIQAFKDFDNLQLVYNNARIYHEIPVHKSYMSSSEILEKVTDHMGAEIANEYSGLHYYFLTPNRLSPVHMNKLRVVDRMSSHFYLIWESEQRIAQALQKVNEFNMEYNKRDYMGSFVRDALLGGYGNLFVHLSDLFERAHSITDEFKYKETEAPYCFMHKQSAIESCVSKFGLGSYTDAFDGRTCYTELLHAMSKRLGSLITTIAKYAPD